MPLNNIKVLKLYDAGFMYTYELIRGKNIGWEASTAGS
jgi:hypothetical protein